MKRLFALSLPLLLSLPAFAGPFTGSDLVVFTVGNGSALSGTAMSGALYEYNTATVNQSVGNTVALPSTFTVGGSASAEGFLKLSTDGNYLTMFGYNAAVGSAAPSGTAPATVNRVVARIDMSGNVDTTTRLTDSTGSARSAISPDGNGIWVTTSSGGSRYTTFGSTTTSVGLVGGNLRVAGISGGQLYISTAAAGVLGVATVGTGLPTTTGQTMTELSGMPTTGTHSSYDFFFKDANTLYVADDGNAAGTGGIQKWTLNAGTWTLSYTLLNNGTTTTGCRGLTGLVDGSGNVELFATTTAATANTLIEVTDTGVNTSVFTVLATAPTGDAFRGVAFLTPVPEPSCFALAGLGLLALAASRRSRR